MMTRAQFRVLVLAGILMLGCLSISQSAEEKRMATTTPSGKRQVAILLYDGVELLDFAGPGEVFDVAGSFEGFDVFTVSDNGEQINSQGFLKVLPNYSFDTCPEPAILVIPGGRVAPIRQAHVLDFIREKAQNAEVVMSVCTGAIALAETGLLDGKSVTSHRSVMEFLRTSTPAVTVVEDARFIDEGKFVTCAGVSAGIDGSLHVLARLTGEVVARQAAEYMEYDWKPSREYPTSDEAENAFLTEKWDVAATLYAQRADEEPSDLVATYRAGTSLARADRPEDALPYLERAQDGGIDDTRMIYQLAGLQVYYGDSGKAAANFRKLIARGEDGWQVYYNLACAEAKQGHNSEALVALEGAVDAGYDDIDYLLEDEDLKALRETDQFKVLVARIEK